MKKAGLVAALFLVTGAHAAAIEADMIVRGDVVFQGASESAFQAAGAMVDFRGPTHLDNTTFAFNGTYTIVEAERAHIHSMGLAGAHTVPLGSRSQEISHGQLRGTVKALLDGPQFSLRVLPTESCEFHGAGDFSVGALQRPYERYARQPGPLGGGPDTFPSQSSLVRSHVAEVNCSVRVILADATLLHEGGEIELHKTTEEKGLGGQVAASREAQRYAVLEGDLSDPSQGWAWYASGGKSSLEGDLELHGASGAGEVNGTALPEEPNLLQIHGAMDIVFQQADGGNAWSLQGESAFVGIDAETFWGIRGGDVAPVAMAASVAVAVAGLVFRVVVGLRTKAGATDHPVRHAIMAHLTHEGAATIAGLQALSGKSRTAVLAHVRTLARAGFVQVKHVQDVALVVPNSGSATGMVPLANGGQVRAYEILGVLQHQRRRQFYDLIVQHAALTYKDVALHWGEKYGESAPPQSSLAHHIGILQRHGLIRKQREGGTTLFVNNVDLREARIHQLVAYLKTTGGFEAFRQVFLLGEAKANRVQASRRVLDSLVFAGYVERTEGRALRVAPGAAPVAQRLAA